MGCDYLEPIKGIGPSTAYKLMKEHGSLKKVVATLRAKQAAKEEEFVAAEEEEEDEEEAKAEEEEEEEVEEVKDIKQDGEGDDDGGVVVRKTGGTKRSRARIPDSDADSDEEGDGSYGGGRPVNSEGEDEISEQEEEDEGVTKNKGKGKAKANPVVQKGTKGKSVGAPKKAAPKKKGGIIIPDDWNWEGAKALFVKPDVIKADDIEVSFSETWARSYENKKGDGGGGKRR